MDNLLFDCSMEIIRLIQKHDIIAMKTKHCCERISAECIFDIIEDYGGTVSEINDLDYKNSFQYVKLDGENKYMTYLDLVIDGERSDLTLICEIEMENGIVKGVQIDDLHVL